MSVGPTNRYVIDIVRAYRSQELINPDYQREYVWSHKKAMHFLTRTIAL